MFFLIAIDDVMPGEPSKQRADRSARGKSGCGTSQFPPELHFEISPSDCCRDDFGCLTLGERKQQRGRALVYLGVNAPPER